MSDSTGIPVIGLVGGIGSGKSAVASWLAARRNVVIVNGDEAGHQVLKQREVKRRIRERFGDSVFDEQGEIIRSALARVVFGPTSGHRQARAELESIVHPEIRKVFHEAILAARSSRAEAVILDAAVLLESGWRDLCDTVVFVDAPRAVRLRRIVENRGWDEAQLQKREASQWPVESKRSAADELVDNSGSLAEAGRQLERVLDRVL